jgi:histidinol-phosphate phosphatase family protein
MVDVKYCDNPDLVQLLPGAAEGLRSLKSAGFRIVIVTNQSGIGRGYFDVKTLEKVHDRLRSELRKNGADYDAIYYCPHKPEDDCDCRKPKPGLFLKAASELNIDLASSYTLGDRKLDVEAGRAAGTRTILVSNNSQTSGHELLSAPDFVVSDLHEAADVIVSSAKAPGAKTGRRIRSRFERN